MGSLLFGVNYMVVTPCLCYTDAIKPEMMPSLPMMAESTLKTNLKDDFTPLIAVFKKPIFVICLRQMVTDSLQAIHNNFDFV